MHLEYKLQLHVLPIADSEEEGWVTGVTSHTIKRLKRTLPFTFSVVVSGFLYLNMILNTNLSN